MPTRRQLLQGILGSALIAGFDPVQRRWVTAEAATSCPALLDVPPLDGTLLLDPLTLDAAATDQGNIVRRVPCAVLRPGSVLDIQKMVRYCRRHGLQVAARGQGHTTHGQALVAGGLVIENRSLNRIHSIGAQGADVDAGVLWRELLEAAYPHGLTPPAITGYTKLSVGGTLSVGGVGAQTTNTAGMQMERVRELEVVTGTGDLVRCSAHKHADLFEAMLGGLGQCGVITRAIVDLVPAKQRARVHNISYTDAGAFFRDFRTLLYRGELNSVYNVWFPFGTNVLYQIQAVAFYDADTPPDSAHLMRDLSVPPEAVTSRDSTYLDYLFLIDDLFDGYIAAAGFDELIKPWFDVWLPESIVEPYVSEVVSKLTLRDVGPTGFVLILPQRRGSISRPFYRVPDVPPDEFVYLFDVLTSSVAPGPDPAFVAEMLERNRALYDQARAGGATRYLIGSLEFNRDDWADHYGSAWQEFRQRKKRFDPDGILNPGLGIFS